MSDEAEGLRALHFKIDENLPIDAVPVFAAAGYECHSVYDELLDGASDAKLIDRCRLEGRVLVTLDLDFSDVRTYAPGSHPGIIVLRPRRADINQTLALLRRLIPMLGTEQIFGNLWIVDETRVRIRTAAP